MRVFHEVALMMMRRWIPDGKTLSNISSFTGWLFKVLGSGTHVLRHTRNVKITKPSNQVDYKCLKVQKRIWLWRKTYLWTASNLNTTDIHFRRPEGLSLHSWVLYQETALKRRSTQIYVRLRDDQENTSSMENLIEQVRSNHIDCLTALIFSHFWGFMCDSSQTGRLILWSC